MYAIFRKFAKTRSLFVGGMIIILFSFLLSTAGAGSNWWDKGKKLLDNFADINLKYMMWPILSAVSEWKTLKA